MRTLLVLFALISSAMANDIYIKVHSPGGEVQTFEQSLSQNTIVIGKSGWLCVPRFSNKTGGAKNLLLSCHLNQSQLPSVIVTSGCNDASIFLESHPTLAKMLPEMQGRDLGLAGKDGQIWRIELICNP